MNLLTITTAAIASFASSGFASEVHLKGDLQIWKRTCDSAEVCDTTFIHSEKMRVDAVLSAPRDQGELTAYRTQASFEDIEASLQTFYKLTPDEGYLSHQVTLSLRDTGHPVAQCTIYQDIAPTTFPVGACTGFVAANEAWTQYGVTLWQAP